MNFCSIVKQAIQYTVNIYQIIRINKTFFIPASSRWAKQPTQQIYLVIIAQIIQVQMSLNGMVHHLNSFHLKIK